MKGYPDTAIKAMALDHAFHQQPVSVLAGENGGWNSQQKKLYLDTYLPALKAATQREVYTSIRTHLNHP